MTRLAKPRAAFGPALVGFVVSPSAPVTIAQGRGQATPAPTFSKANEQYQEELTKRRALGASPTRSHQN